MSTAIPRRLAALGAVVLAASVMVPLAAHAAPPEILDEPITLDQGHIDAFNPVLDDETDEILLALKEDATGSGVLRTPESVTLLVKESALTDFPAIPAIPSGLHDRQAYYLPLIQDHSLVWPGWDTQRITSSFPDADTDIVVSAIDGPGEVFLWSSGSFGTLTSLIKDGSYKLPNTISQPYPAHTHANWAFTEPGTYKFTVHVDVTGANGHTGSSDKHVYTFQVGDPREPEPTEYSLAIEGLSHHYHQGSPIQLEANLDPEFDGAIYRWYMKRADQDAAIQLDGETSSFLTITAEQALDGATVYAEAVDADSEVLATSEPVTIEIDDHGAAPYNVLSIAGLAHHYHAGDPIELTTTVTPASVLNNYRWTVTPVDGEPIVKDGDALSLEAAANLNGASIVAELLFDDGKTYVTSEPVVIEVEDHEPTDEPTDPEITLAVTGLKDSYAPGENLELDATPEPTTDLDHWHWFITRAGSDTEEVISDATTSTLSLRLTAEDDGAKVIARLYNEDHSLAAESTPVVVNVVVSTDQPTDDPTDDPTDGTTDDPTDGTTDDPTDDPTDGTTTPADETPATGVGGILPILGIGVLLLGLGGALVMARSRALA